MAPLKHFVCLLIVASVAILVRGRDKELRRLFREIGLSSSCVAHLPDCCWNREKDCSDLIKNQQLKLTEKLMETSDLLKFSLEEVKKHLNGIQESVKESVAGVKNELKLLQKFPQNEPQNPPKKPGNCRDIQSFGDKESGVRTVYPFSSNKARYVFVFCNQTVDGGGWTVIQLRDVLIPREDFFRDWEEYRGSFGNIGGEHWLGLDNIHALVKDTPMELRVDLEDFEGEKRFAKYDHFFIEDASGKYRLHLGKYSGDAGDSFVYHNGMQFSTKYQDNDLNTGTNCAKYFHGAWWYEKCFKSSLNGIGYNESNAPKHNGIHWKKFKGDQYSLKSSSMMLRPKFY